MTFRAVFCDIDGTLLDSTHRLRPATAQGIRALHAAGTPFILVSARSPSGIFPLQREIGVAGPIVCYGGGLVMDGSGKPIHSIAVDMERIVGLKERIRQLWPSVAATVYSHDDWFVDDIADPRVTTEAEITGAVPTEAAATDLAARATEAHKIFCIGSPEDILAMETAVGGENPDLAVIRSNPRYLEIMDGRATKANALDYLCQAMRLSPADVVAFGDNYNDADMLEHAGLGIAMGNAPDEVKRRAGRTTADNDHEGVLLALNSLKFVQTNHSVRFDRASFQG